MTDGQGLVRDFHRVFELPRDLEEHSAEEARLRATLILEEAIELAEAYTGIDLHDLEGFARGAIKHRTVNADAVTLEQIAKETADVLVVVYGGAVERGFSADLALEEVHASNMTKLGSDNRPIKRDDGKILKGPDYRPPDLSVVLREETR